MLIIHNTAVVCLYAAALLLTGLGCAQGRLLERLTREEHGEVHDLTWVYLIAVIALSWLVRLQQSGANAFIYFQF